SQLRCRLAVLDLQLPRIQLAANAARVAEVACNHVQRARRIVQLMTHADSCAVHRSFALARLVRINAELLEIFDQRWLAMERVEFMEVSGPGRQHPAVALLPLALRRYLPVLLLQIVEPVRKRARR